MIEGMNSKGLKNKLAGQIGEYLVCAELARRDLIATPFAGNVPTFDVLATDELCRTVPIQVKTTRGDSWPSDATRWMQIRFDSATNADLFWASEARYSRPRMGVCCHRTARRARSFLCVHGSGPSAVVCCRIHALDGIQGMETPTQPQVDGLPMGHITSGAVRKQLGPHLAAPQGGRTRFVARPRKNLEPGRSGFHSGQALRGVGMNGHGIFDVPGVSAGQSDADRNF